MTGGERLAKVAEVQEQHAYCRSRTDGDTTTWECGIVTSGGFPHFPAMQRVHVTQALAPLLDEFRAEDEARPLREAADTLWRIFLRLPHTPSPLGDYVQRKSQEFRRAALGAAEPDAGAR